MKRQRMAIPPTGSPVAVAVFLGNSLLFRIRKWPPVKSEMDEFEIRIRRHKFRIGRDGIGNLKTVCRGIDDSWTIRKALSQCAAERIRIALKDNSAILVNGPRQCAKTN